MPTISLKAHFYGRAIQLDEAFDLPFDAQLLVTVLSPAPFKASAELEPHSASRREEIETWIQNAESLTENVAAENGPRLRSAVAEIRQQARELARRSLETSP